MQELPTLAFNNSYTQLPENFYTHQNPTPAQAPSLITVNHSLATQLGIDSNWLQSESGVQVIAGNMILPNSTPIATVYAGHQFGGWNPQLGDGRAVLLGELIDSNNQRYDLQLKGSGRTAYSRGGDGRSPLGPVLREYIVSEAMAALGVPTSRSLAAVNTGEGVSRESILPGAVLARVASSHIRIGTFQYFSARNDVASLSRLANYVIDRHYPEAQHHNTPALALLQAVINTQANLVAYWQGLGFIHGVMNTDNVLICGETIDYGPCAFMDNYQADKVFSSIDRDGRYAYQNQPAITHWNLAQFAQCLIPLLDKSSDRAIELAQHAINEYPELFSAKYSRIMDAKLGLQSASSKKEEDDLLAHDFLDIMASEQADFTLAFRRLAELADPTLKKEQSIAQLFEFSNAFTPWLSRWSQRCSQEQQTPAQRQAEMLNTNPAFIPRNHQLEKLIRMASEEQNFQPFHDLHAVLQHPFRFEAKLSEYAAAPTPEEAVQHTFCGT